MMTVELKPETERLVHEAIRRGHFQIVDEVFVQGVYALRERSKLDVTRVACVVSATRACR